MRLSTTTLTTKQAVRASKMYYKPSLLLSVAFSVLLSTTTLAGDTPHTIDLTQQCSVMLTGSSRPIQSSGLKAYDWQSPPAVRFACENLPAGEYDFGVSWSSTAGSLQRQSAKNYVFDQPTSIAVSVQLKIFSVGPIEASANNSRVSPEHRGDWKAYAALNDTIFEPFNFYITD